MSILEQDRPSTAYYSYIISLLKKDNFGYDLLERRKLPEWPRIDEYENFINSIVSVGSVAPVQNIRTLVALLSNTEDKNIIELFQSQNEDDTRKKYRIILLYFIYADTVIQLISSIDKTTRDSLGENQVFAESVFNICQNAYLKNLLPDREDSALEMYKRLIRQCSAIAFIFHSKFFTASENFGFKLSTMDPRNKYDVDLLFIFYRFLQPPNDPLNSIKHLQCIIDKKDLMNNDAFRECVKYALYNLPPAEYRLETKKIEPPPPNTIYKLEKLFSSDLEIKALYYSRNTAYNIDNIINLINDEQFKRADNKVCLSCFLHFLRKPGFKPLNEFWEFGAKNDNSYLSEEKDLISDYDNDKLIEVFFKSIVEKIDNNLLSTKIIINLLARNPSKNINEFARQLANDKQQKRFYDKVKGPFFNALTIVLNQRYKFFVNNDGESFKNDKQFNQFIQNEFTEIANNTQNFTEIPSFCRFVSPESCKPLSTDQDIMPYASDDAFKQRFAEAKRMTDEIIPNAGVLDINDFFNNNTRTAKSKMPIALTGIISLLKPTKEAFEWQAKIYLITVFFHIHEESPEMTTDFFIKLTRLALDAEINLSYFALYALQVFYIKIPQSSFLVLEAITSVMKERTIGERTAFTLLNLLSHIFTFPPFAVDLNDTETKNRLKKWVNEIQAILLACLTSEFAHVRDITLVVMERLNSFLDLERFNEFLQTSENIYSLMDNHNSIMMQRIANRLNISGNTSNSLEKVNFSIICRSPNIYLNCYAFVEYARVLSRESMKDVLNAYFDLELWKTIKENDIVEKQLPYISFAQRICPMETKSKDTINDNLSKFPGMHSLKSDQILDKDSTLDEQYQEMIKSFNDCDEKTINKCINQLGDTNNRTKFDILAAFANSLSIELIPKFIDIFVSYLEKPIKNIQGYKKNLPLLALQLSKIICCIVLSSDFNLFACVHTNAISKCYNAFVQWYLSSYNFVTFANDDQNAEYLLGFCSTLCSLSQLSELNLNLLDIEISQNSFKFWLNRLETTEKIIAEKSIINLANSVKIFDSKYALNKDIYPSLIRIEMNNPNSRVLRPILIHHPDLLDDYLTRSTIYSINNGYYFYRAICEYFIQTFKGLQKDEISNKNNKKTNELLNNKVSEVVENCGKLILSSLVFIGSSHDDLRKNAYSLLKCILPILCAFQDKENLQYSGNINLYLKQNKNKLSTFSITPSREEVFELSKYISENMPFVTCKVFEAFFSFFKCPNNFNEYITLDNDIARAKVPQNSTGITIMSPIYFTILLNAVSPFSRNLKFEQKVPVYPQDFHNKVTTKKGIEFINNLIDIYPLLSKGDISYFAKVFNEACHPNENIPGLSKMLIMNSNSINIAEKPHIIDATFTIVQYLIQNSNTAEFLSLIIQPLTFGFWFTNKYCSQEFNNIRATSYQMLDWLDLSFRIIIDLMKNDFSCLLPYIHTIIHYCLIYNNINQRINNRTSILLKGIFKNLNIQLTESSNLVINFNGKKSELEDTSNLINEIRDSLADIIPSSLKLWKEDSLQWATSCGDLILASRSAIIYSSLKVDFNCEENNEIIFKSLHYVIRQYAANVPSTEKECRQLFYYIHGSLKMMLSNIPASSSNNLKESLNKFILYSIYSLSAAEYSDEIVETALEIIEKLVKEDPSRLNSDFYPIFSKLVAISFNEPKIAAILTALIAKNISQKDEVILLSHLLLFFYATISAHLSASPFVTFVSNDLIAQLNKTVNDLRNRDSNYSKIISKAYPMSEKENEYLYMPNKKPIDFIANIAEEVWNNDSDLLTNISEYYQIILVETYSHEKTKNDNTIRDIVYVIVKAFIDKCPNDEEKLNKIPDLFDRIVSYALLDNTQAARDLLGTHSKISYSRTKANDSRELKKLPSVIDVPKEIEIKPFGAISYGMLYDIRKIANHEYNPTSEPIVDFQRRTLPRVLMICNNLEIQDDITLLKTLLDSSFQPFEQQSEFWKAIQNEKFVSINGPNNNEPTVDGSDLYAHSQAKAPTPKTIDELYASRETIDPKSFILRDDEFEAFDIRLNAK